MAEQQTPQSSLRQKLGSLLQNLGSRAASSRPEEPWKPEQTVFLTEDILKEISSDSPLPLRLRAIKELNETVATKRLEQYGVQAVWLIVKDLLESSNSIEVRHLVLGFLRCLMAGQYEDLGVLRAHFFRVVQTHNIPEDFQPCFDVVYTLTDSGKNIQYIERDVGPYLAKVLTDALNYGRSTECLTMLVNLIKHNSTYIEEEDLIDMISECCQLITSCKQLPISELSLEVINAVMCYSSLPSSSLNEVIITLCHTLNVLPLSKHSSDMILRLLGTHLGYTAILTLCSILQDRGNWANPIVLRGAVFCISMSLWGSQRVESLKVSFASVLPSIEEVSKCSHTIVIYEVSLSMLRLIRAYSHQFYSSEWDTIYCILEHIQHHLINWEFNRVHGETSALVQVVHDIFSSVASVHSDHTHPAMDANKFFSVVNKATSLHQLSLVIKLLIHEVNNVEIGSLGWVEHLMDIMRRFYVEETGTAIRLEALNQLQEILLHQLLCYESDILEGVVLPLLSSVADDADEDVCCRAVQLLMAVLSDSTPRWVPPILGIINTVFQRGLQLVNKKGEDLMLPESKAAVFGLTELFKSKLGASSDVAAQVFQLLINYLQQQIEEKCFVPATCIMRIKIFNCILSLRASEEGWIGLCDETQTIVYSSFYVCEKSKSDQQETGSEVVLNEIFLNCSRIFSAVCSCLTEEREWAVLVEVLVSLNKLLQDRKLTVSASPNLSELCRKVCHIADNYLKWTDRLYNVQSRRSEDELIVYLFPVLSSLCTYGNQLDRSAQNTLVCCLERGVVGTCSLLCIRALNVAALEMQGTMARLLPRVLHRIGQVLATPTMAIPVLELLASIIGLPSLYSGFVERQYLGIFGTAIPYTDPSKHNTYVITLAHHVIAMWFIRCRIQYRPTVAKFINKSLSALLSFNTTFDDPFNRKRSISFTATSSHTYQQQQQQHREGGGVNGGVVYSKNTQMMDMVDVCIDMMARYAYSNISTQPFRSSAADFLVGGGPSKTWLLGNTLVTITTSGTGGGVQGVCPRCKAIQRSLQPDPDVLLAGNESYDPASAIDGSRGNEALPTTLCSCWCRGWAEVKVRRPTGNVAWLMRIQNKLDILATPQPVDEYDWSLLGLNKEIGHDQYEEEEEEEIDEESEWGILTYDEEEFSHDLSHSVSTQSHDVSHLSDDQSHDASHLPDGQSHDFKASEPLADDSSGLVADNEKSHDKVFPVEDSVADVSSCDVSSNSSPAAAAKRKPTSHSWSERGVVSTPVDTTNRSYSLSVPLEHLPPLFSYDEGHLLGRSPSLLTGLLSDPEQLELITSASLIKPPTTEDQLLFSESEGDVEEEAPLVITAEVSTKQDEANPLQENSSLSGPHLSTDQQPVVAQQQTAVMDQREEIKPLPSSFQAPPTNTQTTPKRMKPRKRVIFPQFSSNSSLREDTPTDIFNNPAFIFLQLYHSAPIGTFPADTPLLLPVSESIERALKVLDHIPTYNTHKIGVVYVDKDQTTEQEILANTSGSFRYLMFLRGVGQMIKLIESPPKLIYLGGLDTSGIDGEFACFWEDDITQVIFHVATLLPTLPGNSHCSNKKLHIGNDFVTIVYNDSGTTLDFGVIKGQFNYAEVVIQPLPCGMNRVSLAVKKGLETFVDCSASLVSDKWLPLLVRQKALLANLASLVMLSESTTDYYPSNWLGRLHQINHIRERTLSEVQTSSDKINLSPTTTPTYIPDFTQYC